MKDNPWDGFSAEELAQFEELAGGRKEARIEGVSTNNFYAYMPQHLYIFVPTRSLWPAASVNSRIKLKDESASSWLDNNKPVKQMTWVPGEPMLIRDRLITEVDGSSTAAPHASICIGRHR